MMRKKKFLWALMLVIIFSGMFAAGGASSAAEVKNAEARLSDSAGILSTAEAEELEQNLNQIVERYEVGVVLITSDSIGKKDPYKTYVKKQKKAAESENLLLIFVSVKKKEELCCIRAYGTAKENLTTARLERLESAAEKRILKGEPQEALEYLIGRLLEKMSTDPYFDALPFHPGFHLILCLSVTAGILFFLLRHPKEKQKKESIPYLDEKYSTLQGSLDHFSHVSVKAVKEKKSSGKRFFRKGKKQEEDEDEFSELEDDMD